MFFFLGLLFCSNSLACVSYHGIQCDFFSWNTSKVLQDLFYCCDCLINLKYAAVKFNVSQHKRHTNRTQTHTQCNAKYILHAMRGTFFIYSSLGPLFLLFLSLTFMTYTRFECKWRYSFILRIEFYFHFHMQNEHKFILFRSYSISIALFLCFCLTYDLALYRSICTFYAAE